MKNILAVAFFPQTPALCELSIIHTETILQLNRVSKNMALVRESCHKDVIPSAY